MTASPRHGGFGLRRGGILDAITGGRAFTTQHIIWAPDSAFAELQRGQVIDPRGDFELTHYGTVLSIEPAGFAKRFVQSMRLGVGANAWARRDSLPSWSRHGGVGVAVAPGTLTPRFPAGGIHLDTTQLDTRHDVACPVTELAPEAVALGDLESRSFLTAGSVTGLASGQRVLIDDGTNLAISEVIATVPVASSQRIQLTDLLGALGTSNLTLTQLSSTAASTESHAAAPIANALAVQGTAATYAAADVVRVTASTSEILVARVERLEARLPLERPLPAGLAGPIAVAQGVVSPSATSITLAGANIDFGSATRPGVGSVGLISAVPIAAGNPAIAVRIEAHDGASAASLDVPLPAAIAGASSLGFRAITAGAALGRRQKAPRQIRS
jgi:hypothetical protein